MLFWSLCKLNISSWIIYIHVTDPSPLLSYLAPPPRLYTLFTDDDYSSLIVDFPWEQRPPQPPPPAFIMMPDHLHCLQLSNTNILLSNISNIMHATNLILRIY